MIPDLFHIDADHVQKYFLMNAMDFVLDTVSIIALEVLLVGGFDSTDEKFLKYFDEHLLECLVAWLDIHFITWFDNNKKL